MAGLPVLALPGLTSDEGLWHHQAAALGAVHPFISFALTPHATMVELAAMALARAPAGRFALRSRAVLQPGFLTLSVPPASGRQSAAIATAPDITMTTNVGAYAAHSSDSPLGLFRFARRSLRGDDVSIDILYCGVCHAPPPRIYPTTHPRNMP